MLIDKKVLDSLLVKRKGTVLRKFMIMAMMLAMTLAAAIPALAQVGQEGEQETESGDVDQSFEVASEGDNSNQCPNIQGVAQTGNSQNQLDLVQDSSIADDFEFDEVSSTIDESPANTATCDQQVNQAASASG